MKYRVERISFQNVTVREHSYVEAPAGLSEEELSEWFWDEQYEFDWIIDEEECTDSYTEELDWIAE